LDPSSSNILFTHVDPANYAPDLWAFFPETQDAVKLVAAKGYDGGAFFSPDGQWICYRSDRKGDNNLQLFLGELEFADATHPARVMGVKRELQITAEADVVNWAPFWHPSGEWLIYASSAQGHRNYELFSIYVQGVLIGSIKPDDLAARPQPRVRVTHATGLDGLLAFDAAGTRLIFTSQRANTAVGDERRTRQVWVTRMGKPQ